ncbi:ATP-binding protein [Actinoplanes sp. NPDC051633]|uniref:ATP-binding protein n=1 Tax=Actinoplanes sp. NPDC051633 TaxID=3155670 RepID=UPI003437175C
MPSPAPGTGTGSAGTFGELLASRRQRRFVGRTAEVELFRSALDSAEPPFLVLHVHGPPGVGKTSLLDVCADLATGAGARPVRLDGRDLIPSPSAVLEVLGEVLDVPDGDGAIGEPSGGGRVVILLDTYERLAPLDDWVRTRLLPRLPATVLIVVAGRAPPASAWRADPAWRELLRVVSLRNLSPEDSRRYLQACGVDPARHHQLVEQSHGHPLGLSLMADVLLRGGELAADPLTPDLVGILLRRFVEIIPDGRHRRALEVCALARSTTESLLREVLWSEDTHEEFGWLRGLSFVEQGADGLFPHDLARDTLEADLRWRDPDRYRGVLRGIRSHINVRLRSPQGHNQQQAIADAKYMFRRLPGVLSPVDWDAWGQHDPEPARPEDQEAILDLVLTAEGAESAAIAARWWDRQPEGFFVVRSAEGVLGGFLALVNLTRASADDIAADPGAQAAWAHAARLAPPRPTETVTQSRFVVDRDAYQGPSPTFNATPMLTMQRYLSTPKLAWDFLTLAEPERWDAYFAAADMPRAAGADFWVGGRRYGLFAHDFRQVPVGSLLELVTERALSQDLTSAATAERPPLLVLSQPEFDDSVRQALRDLRRPDLLARNPLQQTRLVRGRAGAADPSAATLAAVVSAAVESLREHPRDDKLWRAVERTYLRSAATQERAAEALGLPFSTFRRHLTQGVDRVVAWLWDREIYGEQH